MTHEELVEHAVHWLTMRANEGVRLEADGHLFQTYRFAFQTGFEFTDAEGNTIAPSTEALTPGTWRFELAREALANNRLQFVCADLSNLIEAARKDNAAYDACLLIAKTKLAQGELMPPELSTWVANHLEKPNRPRKGGHKKFSEYRAIWRAVELLGQQGVTRSRNEASTTVCAYDIVAEALIKIGRPGDWRAVRKAWEKIDREYMPRP